MTIYIVDYLTFVKGLCNLFGDYFYLILFVRRVVKRIPANNNVEFRSQYSLTKKSIIVNWQSFGNASFNNVIGNCHVTQESSSIDFMNEYLRYNH